MARKSNGPWWNADKGKWFVWHDGRRVNLKTEDEREAVRRWHRLMAGVHEQPVTPTPIPDKPKGITVTVKQLADAFLTDAEQRMSKACWRNYSLFLNTFTNAYGAKQAETVTDTDVEGVSRNPKWSTTYRSGFVGCVLTVYRWGMRNKVIGVNPIGDMKKPPKESRGADTVVSRDVHERLLAHADPLFADVGEPHAHSGCWRCHVSICAGSRDASLNPCEVRGRLSAKEHGNKGRP